MRIVVVIVQHHARSQAFFAPTLARVVGKQSRVQIFKCLTTARTRTGRREQLHVLSLAGLIECGRSDSKMTLVELQCSIDRFLQICDSGFVIGPQFDHSNRHVDVVHPVSIKRFPIVGWTKRSINQQALNALLSRPLPPLVVVAFSGYDQRGKQTDSAASVLANNLLNDGVNRARMNFSLAIRTVLSSKAHI